MKEIIIKALKRNKRKLRIIKPDEELSKAHIKKARHNLEVMNKLNDLNYTDWSAVVAYYAMYHGAMAILSKIGLKSKDHATATIILEYFFSKHIDKSLLKKFNELKKKKEDFEQVFLEDRFIDYIWSAKNLRETAQYGTNTFIPKNDETIEHAKEFILAIRALIDELDEDYILVIQEQIEELNQE